MKTLSKYWCKELETELKNRLFEPYTMSLASSDAKAALSAVNMGIDSYLEACYVPDRGDKYQVNGTRLDCVVSVESLPVLIRRLLDQGDDSGLASGICETLGIELV